MEFDTYLRALVRHWWLVLSTLLICAAAAGAYTEAVDPVYKGTSTALVVVDQTRNNGGDSDGAAKSRATTYAALANSDATALLAANELKIKADPTTLLDDIDIEVTPETALIEISARAKSRGRAVEIADAWMSALTTRVNQIENPDESQAGSARLEVVEAAVAPEDPVYPRPALNLAISLLVGLVIGSIAAVLLDVVRRRVRSAAQIGETWGAEVLAQLPEIALRRGRRIPVMALLDDAAEPAVVEQLREARLKLTRPRRQGGPPGVIVLASPSRGQGTSTVALNLAAALAATGKPTVLVEADLERPAMAAALDLDRDVGLWQVLEGSVPLDSALQPSLDQRGLHHLVAGTQSLHGAEALGSQAMAGMIETLRLDHLVLIDAPAVLGSSVASVLSPMTDGIILVTPPHPQIALVTAALDKLDVVRAAVLGIVTTARRGSVGRGVMSSLFGRRPSAAARTSPAPVEPDDLEIEVGRPAVRRPPKPGRVTPSGR